MNIFKKFNVVCRNIFVVSALLASVSSAAYGMQAPIRFNNLDFFDGGICFANASMQCLLQQPGFCDFIKQHHSSDVNCSMIWDLQHKSNTGLYNSQPSVWPFLQHLEQQCQVGKNAMAFVLGIAQQLEKGPNRNFSTHSFFTRNGNGYSFNPSLLNGSIRVRFNDSNKAFSCNGADNGEIISILPDIRCGVMSLDNGNLDNMRNYEEVVYLAQRAATGVSQVSNNQLKGIVVFLKTSCGVDHSVSYVQHKGLWWFCDAVENDYGNFFHSVGPTIDDVKMHVDFLPFRYNSRALSGDISFTSPSVNILFFELDQNACGALSRTQSKDQSYGIYNPVYALSKNVEPCKKEVSPQYHQKTPSFGKKEHEEYLVEINTIDDVNKLSLSLGLEKVKNLKTELYRNNCVGEYGLINKRGEQLINNAMQYAYHVEPCKKEVSPQYHQKTPSFGKKEHEEYLVEINTIDDVNKLSLPLGLEKMKNLKAELYRNNCVGEYGLINKRGEQLINNAMKPFMV